MVQLKEIVSRLRTLRNGTDANFVGQLFFRRMMELPIPLCQTRYHAPVCSEHKLANFLLGSIDGQPVRDIIFEAHTQGKIHPCVSSLHDWPTGLANRHHPNFEEYVDPMRHGLQDDTPIVFTHGDLHPRNIIVSLPVEESESMPLRVLS